jgi:pyridoxamine 5'-phosphate oxidase
MGFWGFGGTARTVWAMSLADLRKDYTLAGLTEKDLARDPFRQFEKWFQEAEGAKVVEPNAMTLATATKDGRPSARTVLLKGVDGRGFLFFSNYQGRKGINWRPTRAPASCFPGS